jgi:isocitrate lyase
MGHEVPPERGLLYNMSPTSFEWPAAGGAVASG